MIGFFDSWFWGLQTMKYFCDLYSEYDYIFLADNKNCPFWDKNWDDIKDITFKALDRLFDQWAKIVIIACNTAAAHSIRKRQALYPHKKVLSITIPGVEELIENSDQSWSVWILATKATILSDIYNDLYNRFGWQWDPDFHFVAGSSLVNLVESGEEDISKIIDNINSYLWQFPDDLETLILGCTHFSVYKKYFDSLFAWKIVDPSYYSAQKFLPYLQNHLDIKNSLSQNSSVKFYTTWNTENFDNIWSKIWWQKINSILLKSYDN